MANEAIVVDTPSIIRDFTVAEDATIEMLTLCQLTDPRTASASDGANVFAGIAMSEKKASDDQVNLGLAQDGVFDLVDAGDGGSAGAMVVLSGANLVRDAVAGELLTGAVVGKRLEDAAASEVHEVDIGVRG